jgi:hypothetical protein
MREAEPGPRWPDPEPPEPKPEPPPPPSPPPDPTRPGLPGPPTGHGPMADDEPVGRPIDDPALADRANPRWDDPTSPRPDAQPLAGPGGTPNVMPSDDVAMPHQDPRAAGTPQDQAARPIEPDVGRDTIRAGLGGGAPNPALAEGGEGG